MQFWHPFDESPCFQWLLMQGYNKLTQTRHRCKGFIVIHSKYLGETSCHKSCLVTFDFTINPMLDFEHPFARNGLPTFGKWYQQPNVVDNKRKNYGGTFHLFGGNWPITKPLLTLLFKPFSLSILLWFIQTLILWCKFFFFRRTIWCKLGESTLRCSKIVVTNITS